MFSSQSLDKTHGYITRRGGGIVINMATSDELDVAAKAAYDIGVKLEEVAHAAEDARDDEIKRIEAEHAPIVEKAWEEFYAAQKIYKAKLSERDLACRRESHARFVAASGKKCKRTKK